MPADTTERLASPASGYLTTWFDGPHYEALRDLSERENCSLQEIVRRAVDALLVRDSIEPSADGL